jgi:hypothetical protein
MCKDGKAGDHTVAICQRMIQFYKYFRMLWSLRKVESIYLEFPDKTSGRIDNMIVLSRLIRKA